MKTKIFTCLLALSSISFFGQNTFPDNGNVGIGTSSPASILTLRNSSLANNAASGSVDLTLATTGSGDVGTKISGYKETFNTAGLAFFTQYGYTSPVEKMRISANGNIGIGTTSPASLLTLRNSSLANNAASGSVDLTFATTSSGDVGTKISGYKETFNTAGLAFFTQYGYSSPVEKMRITANGNVGIGTVNPLKKFQVSSKGASTADKTLKPEKWQAGIGHADGDDKGEVLIGTFGKQPSIQGHGSNTSYRLLLNPHSGNVGIGTLNPDSKLTVKGKIHCEEVLVDLAVPADYVFEKYYTGASNLKEDYKMPSLEEVEAYTKENHHLPNVPSATAIQEKGLELKEMTNLLLQKIEELTLYTIEQEKRIKALEAQQNSSKN